MEKLEAEKRHLQEKLDQPVSAPMSPRNNAAPSMNQLPSLPASSGLFNLAGTSLINFTGHSFPPSSEQAANLTEHIINLRREVTRLKANLEKTERDHRENMAKIIREEKVIKDENVRLQRRLQMEVDRREALCRHLSESESSLEMDDERHFNESSRVRTVSSPIPGYLITNNAVQTATNNNTNANVNNAVIGNTNNIGMHGFSVPATSQLISSAANLLSMQTVTTVERCPTCNQLKTLNINSTGMLATSATSPSSYLNSNMKQNIPPLPAYNPLTASSSLSSSTSSINSSNKLQQSVSLNDNKKC
jgi:coiled-coil domain-containing protein 6